jgi:CBS domain-containing protein
MINIRDILGERKPTIYSVTPETTVYHALEKMSAHDVGSVLIMEQDQLLGIFTERDYMKKIILHDRSSKSTPVKEVMTSNPICVTPANTLDEGLAIITKERVRHLPVIEDRKIVGVLSIGDLVKKKISDLSTTIKHLNDYIISQGGN